MDNYFVFKAYKKGIVIIKDLEIINIETSENYVEVIEVKVLFKEKVEVVG